MMSTGTDSAAPKQISVAPATVRGVSTPRVTIQFCTQCKWMLRAAYYAQELLSTFSTALGEVALIPATGGVFVVTLEVAIGAAAAGANTSEGEVGVEKKSIWDRKVGGGFPETKELKKRIRDIIDPGRNLGHVDGKKKATATSSETTTEASSSKEAAVGSKSDDKESQGIQIVLAERQAEEAKAREEKKMYECEDCQ